MVDYKTKWNKYRIGKVGWINNRKEHPARKLFLDYVEQNKSIKSILEIGGGELIEATSIKETHEDIEYTVVDVSDVFLEHCRRLSKFNCVKGDMCNLPFEDKSFDLIFMSSVLEHSPNILKAVSEASRVANKFVFTFFKWKMLSGSLEARYNDKKKYYTTLFNIDAILDLIESHGGKFEDKIIAYPDGQMYDFEDYRKEQDVDNHRNGNYLTLFGEWL